MGKNVRKRTGVQGDDEDRRVTVQLSLPLMDAMRGMEEDYFGLCVRSGDVVLRAMMERDRTEVCGGPKWARGQVRDVVRAGTTRSEVTLGGRRVGITRPRARTSEGVEVVLPTFAWAANRDPFDRATMSAVSAGVSTRGYESTLDPLPRGIEDRSTAKSSVSRRFIAMSAAKLSEWLNAPLEDLELEAILIDGIHFADHCVLIALGVTAQGHKRILGTARGKDGERHGGAHVADEPRRPRSGSDQATAVRDRRQQGASKGDPRGVGKCGRRPALPGSQDRATFWSISPRRHGRGYAPRCARRTRRRTTRRPRPILERLARDLERNIRAPPHPCARASTKRSPCSVSASAARCSGHCARPTRSRTSTEPSPSTRGTPSVGEAAR